MEIEIEKLAKAAVINLSGRVDGNTSPDLRKTAFKVLSRDKCENLTIDFTRVSFIDTSGLATLLDILLATKERRARLTLSGLNEKIRYLIEVNGLTGFFTIGNSTRERILT
jgi:anti-anti-sigma factor